MKQLLVAAFAKALLTAIFGIFFSSILAATPQLDPYVNKTIQHIVFKGNRKVEVDALKLKINTSVSSPLNLETIRSDIKSLYALDYFDNIAVYASGSTNDLTLTYELKERPSIVEITFDGIEEFEDEHFNEKLGAKIYTIVNQRKIAEDLATIESEYIDKGYYLVDVSYKLEKVSTHEVKLVYVINEHNKTRVRRIHILGNTFFDDARLKQQLAIQEFNRMSWMSSTGIYKDEFFNRDTQFIEFFYMDHGFVRVKVAKPLVFLSPDRDWIDITYSLVEGPQYYVSDVRVTGDIISTEKELTHRLRSKPEKLYKHSSFIRDIETLTDYYADFGYAFVNVTPERPVDDDKKLVSIHYDIQKGEKVYFGDIRIVGNDKTRDNVIRRQLTITEGALYSGSKLKASKIQVQRLGFFKEVTLRTQKVPNRAVVDIIVTIVEKSTGQFQMGVGFSGRESWFMTTQISENNVFGLGQRVSIEGQYNGTSHKASVNWREPYLLDSDWNIGLSLYKWLQPGDKPDAASETPEENKIGFRFSLGHPIMRNLSLHFAYKLENQSFDKISPLYEYFYPTATTSSLESILDFNSTNNYIDPSSGTKLLATFEYAGGLLGGEQDYGKLLAQATYYYNIPFSDYWQTYFRLNAEYHSLIQISDEKIPNAGRFKSGGPKTNRGYPWSAITPTVMIQEPFKAFPRQFNKGGTQMLQFNLEYFYPLISEAGLKGVIFGDASNVFDDDQSLTLKHLKYGVGAGIRWITPIAPLRFELAYPYYAETGKFGELIHHFFIGI